jgi:hypothetical protein
LDDERLNKVVARIQELGTLIGEPQTKLTISRLRRLAAQFLTETPGDNAANDGKK